jgi:hypothetical protein
MSRSSTTSSTSSSSSSESEEDEAESLVKAAVAATAKVFFMFIYLFFFFLSFFLSFFLDRGFVLRVSDLDSDAFPFLLSRGKNTTARNAPERGVSTVHVVPVQEFVVEEVERHHGALVFGVLLRGFAGCRGEYFSRISKQMVDRKSKEEVVRTH